MLYQRISFVVLFVILTAGDYGFALAAPPLEPVPDSIGASKRHLDGLGTSEEVALLKELRGKLERIPQAERDPQSVRLIQEVLPKIASPAARWRLLVCIGDLDCLQGNEVAAQTAFAEAASCDVDADNKLIAVRRLLHVASSEEDLSVASSIAVNDVLEAVTPRVRLETEYLIAERTAGLADESRRASELIRQIDAFQSSWERLLLEGGKFSTDDDLRRLYFDRARALIDILHLKGDSAEAARRLNALGERFPELADTPNFLGSLAVVALGSGETDIGTAAALRTIDRFPDTPAAASALFNLAALYHDQGSVAEAIGYYRRVIEAKGADESLKRIARKNVDRLEHPTSPHAAQVPKINGPVRGGHIGLLLWINLALAVVLLIAWILRRSWSVSSRR